MEYLRLTPKDDIGKEINDKKTLPTGSVFWFVKRSDENSGARYKNY